MNWHALKVDNLIANAIALLVATLTFYFAPSIDQIPATFAKAIAVENFRAHEMKFASLYTVSEKAALTSTWIVGGPEPDSERLDFAQFINRIQGKPYNEVNFKAEGVSELLNETSCSALIHDGTKHGLVLLPILKAESFLRDFARIRPAWSPELMYGCDKNHRSKSDGGVSLGNGWVLMELKHGSL